MEVKVIWHNRNPFCPRIEDMSISSTAKNIDQYTSFSQIEYWAKEATPQGYWLFQIIMPDKIYTYNYQGQIVDKK